MNEKEIERLLCGPPFKAARITNSTTDAKTLFDLIGGADYQRFPDTSEWRTGDKKLMVDIIGGMTPDIVVRSVLSGENRILIEIKVNEELNYGKADSQAVRYFLWLLAMTHKCPVQGANDIRRALLLAAPSEWFHNKKRSEKWRDFVERYSALATSFDITLGEIRCDSIQPESTDLTRKPLRE